MPAHFEFAPGISVCRLRALPSFSRLLFFLLGFLLAPSLPAADRPSPTADAAESDDDDIQTLAAFKVQADRVEDFGLRVWGRRRDPTRGSFLWPVGTPTINAVVPNTAAAKAGLRPGDRILKSDGRSTTVTLFSLNKWRKLQERKWAEVASGKKSVTWTLEVQSADLKETRTVKLTIPTAPPRWGASIWQPPEGRAPATISEAGPLAERARVVMDHGIWALFDGRVADDLGFPNTGPGRDVLGYEWRIGSRETTLHRIFVTQQRGRTEIILEASSREIGTRRYLTTPAAALGPTDFNFRRDNHEFSLEETRADFQRELDFWLNQVGKVSARWPMEFKGGPVEMNRGGFAMQGGGVPTSNTAANAASPPADSGPRAEKFLQLPAATTEQRALFTDAFAKIGADEDRWAYTETSRGLDNKNVIVMRVDPSKPDAERHTLLKFNGKNPTPADVQRWRDDGRDSSAALGDLPPISSLVDTTDIRVLADEPAALVFELPLRSNNASFPADKFQAIFRVNKTHRAFEDMAVKLRESFRVAGVANITDAGMEVRFQTLDPAYAPQPIWLKGGGAIRVLFVKLARDFHSTRTDFKRVEPYEDPSPLSP